MRNALLTLALLALPTLVACGDDDDDTGETGESSVSEVDFSLLTKQNGCSDLYLSQADPAGSLLLEVSYDAQLTEASYNSGVTETVTVDLASDGRVVLSQGAQLQTIPCNDALDGTAVVDKEWTAVSGTVVFSFLSDGSGGSFEFPGQGTVELSDVVLELDGEELSVPDRSWSASAGWLPG